MPTNKIVLREIEEFMSGYVPVYAPIYPLLMNKSQAYPAQVGSIDFKRVSTVGDIRAKHLTPKDTEIKQISVGDGKKTFKKYFLANQFTVSNLQDNDGIEDINAQVLDEHQKQMDELILLGEGTAGNNVINNGLYWSGDANYTLEDSKAIAAGTAADHLKDMHTQIMVSATKADDVAGRKLLLVYGATAIAKFNSLYANTDAPFAKVLGDVLGANWSVSKLPSAVTPSGANGWIVVNLDQVKLHYTVLPSLKAQGVNEEKMYAWFNFLMGSAMVEVLAANGIIRQPVTFA
jgi:hypothetical protein